MKYYIKYYEILIYEIYNNRLGKIWGKLNIMSSPWVTYFQFLSLVIFFLIYTIYGKSLILDCLLLGLSIFGFMDS